MILNDLLTFWLFFLLANNKAFIIPEPTVPLSTSVCDILRKIIPGQFPAHYIIGNFEEKLTRSVTNATKTTKYPCSLFMVVLQLTLNCSLQTMSCVFYIRTAKFGLNFSEAICEAHEDTKNCITNHHTFT